MLKTKDQRLVKVSNGRIITMELCLACPYCYHVEDNSTGEKCSALDKILNTPRDIDPACKLMSPSFFTELEETEPGIVQTLEDGGCEVILSQVLLPSGIYEYQISLVGGGKGVRLLGMQLLAVSQSQEGAETYLENLETYIQWKRQKEEAPVILKTVKF